MFAKPTERRDFLKLTGAGIAGSALATAATVQAAPAKRQRQTLQPAALST